jgi:hypothetical protein
MISSPPPSSPYPQPPLNRLLQQPFPDQGSNGKPGSNLAPSPDFSIPSPKDSFALPDPGASNLGAPPSSPFSVSAIGTSGPGGTGSPSGPGGAPGAAKLPEVTVIGPDPAKNNTNYSWKAIALYGAALLATILAVRHFLPKLRGAKKAKVAAPATT